MRAIAVTALAAILAVTLASCAGGSGIPRERIERALKNAPGLAQPSKVVARELEFARAASEKGQWTAFRAFAAPGAIIHGRGGAVVAETWLAGKKDPVESVRWSPQAVWMSCDSTVAVSQGRFREPDGMVGTFVTVWQRRGDDDYRWVYDAGVRDDPQPPPRPADEPVDDDAIVVSAISSIKGLVADCAKGRGAAAPPPPLVSIDQGISNAVAMSRDRTLRWRWEHPVEGQRRFVAEYLTSGQWQVALDLPLGAVAINDAD